MALRPGPGQGRRLFVARDLARLFKREADIVETVEQAALLEVVDVEMNGAAVRPADRLVLEVDRYGGVGAALGVIHQQREDLLGDADRQDAVLEAVVVENVGEGRRDDAADAEIEQGPWRMLA